MQCSPCLHPKRVKNPVTGEWQYVPCGHCDACVCSKGFHRSERLGQSVARFTHKYFFTLTFSDDFLPVARYNSQLDIYVHPYDTDYNGEVYQCDSLLVEQSLEQSKEFYESYMKYDGVPVLSRRLIILFKKRLRKLFSKIYGKEYLFIYIVGEYGPSTLRPHYHGILCTNAGVKSGVLEECVHCAWSSYDKVAQKYVSEYGRIDFQRIISRGVRNYVAQYLNCNTNLPHVYTHGDFRPFYQSSPLIDSDCLRFTNSSLEKLYDSANPEQNCVSLIDNKSVVSTLPAGIINRVFPKCASFGALSFVDRVQLYAVFERQPFRTAKEFAENVILCYSDSTNSVGLCKSILVDTDYVASFNRLVRHFYISRRVCFNANKLGVSLEQYVQRIELFWSRFDLLKLKHFYELQKSLLEDRFNPVPLYKLFSLYYDTGDIKNLFYYYDQFGLNGDNSFIPKQSQYECLMHKIVLDSTKTKKRNDYFIKRGFRRPVFNPKNSKICRFSQI